MDGLALTLTFLHIQHDDAHSEQESIINFMTSRMRVLSVRMSWEPLRGAALIVQLAIHEMFIKEWCQLVDD